MRETIASATALLVGAHRGGRRLDRLPADCRPESIEEAYAIQDAIIRALGPLGGWKVGQTGNDEPRCAPVPKHRVFDAGATLDPACFPDASLEIEFAFRVNTALPPRSEPYGTDEVAAAVDLIPLIEIVGSRFFNRDTVDPLEKLADLNANAGFVVGRPVPDWRGLDLGRAAVELSIEEKRVQTAIGPGPAGDPLTLLVWQANHATRRCGGLKPGDIVTTGALQGATDIAPGSHAVGDWGDLGRVELAFASA